MYDLTNSERIENLEDNLAMIEKLIKVSFQGTANELDELQEAIRLQQKVIDELTKILDIHYDIIKKIDRKNLKNLT
jgi:uncharacterized coiled-coil protein SlyX